MSILVVGSVAYDDLITPSGNYKDVLGGAATHFSVAARLFVPVSMIGVVGSDFKQTDMALLNSLDINTNGIEQIQSGQTFRWSGKYYDNINQRDTIDTQLGVFESFSPKLNNEHKNKPYVFLANIHPALQLDVLNQMKSTKIVALDTMDLWINSTRDILNQVVEKVDLLFINNEEAYLMTNEYNLSSAAKKIMSLGPKAVVIKLGEYGAHLFMGDQIFSLPGVVLENPKDPTGAGDTFAGGFMGHLAKKDDFSFETLKECVVCGTVTASYQVEGIGHQCLLNLDAKLLQKRYHTLIQNTSFNDQVIF